MFRIGFRSLLLAAGLSIVASNAMADATREPTLQDIVSEQTSLRAKVVSGKGAFKDMDRSERDELAKHQQRVIDTLAGVSSLEELRGDQRADVFNELEWIKAAITKAEDDRMVCEYTSSVGSNRRESKCMSTRRQRELREQSKNTLQQAQTCGDEGCRGN